MADRPKAKSKSGERNDKRANGKAFKKHPLDPERNKARPDDPFWVERHNRYLAARARRKVARKAEKQAKIVSDEQLSLEAEQRAKRQADKISRDKRRSDAAARAAKNKAVIDKVKSAAND